MLHKADVELANQLWGAWWPRSAYTSFEELQRRNLVSIKVVDGIGRLQTHDVVRYLGCAMLRNRESSFYGTRLWIQEDGKLLSSPTVRGLCTRECWNCFACTVILSSCMSPCMVYHCIFTRLTTSAWTVLPQTKKLPVALSLDRPNLYTTGEDRALGESLTDALKLGTSDLHVLLAPRLQVRNGVCVLAAQALLLVAFWVITAPLLIFAML